MRRRLTPALLRQIAWRHVPPGWSMVERAPRPYYDKNKGREMEEWGSCNYQSSTLYVPPLTSRANLYIACHEIGHATLHVDNDPKSFHVREYEAEQFAIGLMRTEAVPVPRSELASAKKNVLDHIAGDVRRGFHIDKHIRAWATPRHK